MTILTTVAVIFWIAVYASSLAIRATASLTLITLKSTVTLVSIIFAVLGLTFMAAVKVEKKFYAIAKQAYQDFCLDYIPYYADCATSQSSVTLLLPPAEDAIANIAPTPLWQQQIQTNLQDLLNENYTTTAINTAIKQVIPSEYKQLSVRKLQKICSQINKIKPNAIVGHYGRKTSKRYLINKIETIYNTI